MLQLLIGIGFAALCLQVAVSPALLAAGFAASSHGRSASAIAKGLMAFAALCGLASIALVYLRWPVLTVLLSGSAISIALTALGSLVVVRVLLLALNLALAPRLRDLPEQAQDRHSEIDSALVDAADTVGLRKVPKLVVVDCSASPAVTGLVRPVLIYPLRLAGLDRESLQIVLTHEMAHLKSGHLWAVQLASSLAKTIWPNPIGRLALGMVNSWAEREADVRVTELDYSLDQIRETRRTVLRFMAAQQASLALAPDQDPEPIPAPTAKLWRVALGVAFVPLSIAGGLLPLAIEARPSLIGFSPNLDRGARSRYALQFATRFGEWTRQHYDVVFVQSGDLYRMRGDGIKPEKLLGGEDKSEPSVSRDGKRIIFLAGPGGNKHLWLSDGKGDRLEQLTYHTEREMHPSISPDGRTAVYAACQGDDLAHAQLILLNLDTKMAVDLSDSVGPGIEPSFGHDGKYILYMSGGHIFRASLDGTSSPQLTFGRSRGGPFQADDHGPVPSPDGSFIAFTRVVGDLENYWYRRPPSGPVNLGYTISAWVMNADGSGQREMTGAVQGQVEYSALGFAPTSLWIAYVKTETFKGAPRETLGERDFLTGEWRSLSSEEHFGGGLSYTGWLRY